MKTRWLTIVAMGCVLHNTGGADDATKDRERLQGTWNVVKVDIKEEAPREYIQKHGRVVIRGDKLAVLFVEKHREIRVLESRFNLTPAKSPKAIDLTIDVISILVPATKEAQKSVEEMKGKTILGIYDVTEDTLKFIFSEAAGERPKRFPTSAGKGAIILQRERP